MKIDMALFTQKDLKTMQENNLAIDFEKDYTQSELEDVEQMFCDVVPTFKENWKPTEFTLSIEHIIDVIQDNYTQPQFTPQKNK